jgi:hypothetical protein
MVDKALALVSERGAVTVHGYVQVNPNNPQELIQLNSWYAENWLCQSVALDPGNVAAGWYPVLTWETGYYEKVKINEEGVDRLAGVRKKPY